MAKKIKNEAKITAFIVSLFTLTVFLSGCAAIGSDKPAALQVTSTPEASVFLDGKHLGKTPFYSDQLKTGTFTLKITASEATFLSEITLQPKTLTYVNRQLASNYLAQAGETLNLVPGTTSFLITTQPQKATVTIDGKLIGATPHLLKDLSEGEHKVEVAANGHISRQFAIRIVKGYQLQAEVTLASEVAKDAAVIAKKPEIPKIEIVYTARGSLSVREEASTKSPEVGSVKSKEQYEVIQETKDWVKISFTDSKTSDQKQGWIPARYTKKL